MAGRPRSTRHVLVGPCGHALQKYLYFPSYMDPGRPAPPVIGWAHIHALRDWGPTECPYVFEVKSKGRALLAFEVPPEKVKAEPEKRRFSPDP